MFHSGRGCEYIMEYFDSYDQKYPDLIISILDYFEISGKKAIGNKSVLDFCEQYKIEDENGHGHSYKFQPQIVDRICKKLCECGQMSCIKNDGGLGLNNNYIYFYYKKEFFYENKERLRYYFNSMVYGFEYIYQMYKNIVIPLVWIKSNGDYAAGTGFKFGGGIVTAKHCIEDVDNLQIKGYTAEELKAAKIYVSDNPGLDLAFIDTQRLEEPQLFYEEGKVMQEVLVMGYPKIPAFTNFLTAEKATISSKALSRITPTMGAIAAYGEEYLAKMEAMLITAKIRGGNSGGPVINANGCLVGVACQIPNFAGDIGEYDDLGYGVAVPVRYLLELIEKKPILKEIPENFFRDYIE